MEVKELTYKGVENSQILDAFKKEGIEIGLTPRIIDIVPTKTEGKSSVFVVSEVELGDSSSDDFNRMSKAERLAQNFSLNSIMRGRVTFSDDVIESLGLEKGGELKFKVGNETFDFRLKVYEQREPFYAGQQPVGRTENGEFKPRLIGGEKFWRDTKVVDITELTQHSLLPRETTTDSVTKE